MTDETQAELVADIVPALRKWLHEIPEAKIIASARTADEARIAIEVVGRGDLGMTVEGLEKTIGAFPCAEHGFAPSASCEQELSSATREGGRQFLSICSAPQPNPRLPKGPPMTLADKIEAAEGASRELDAEILASLGTHVLEKRGRDRKAWWYPVSGPEHYRLDPDGIDFVRRVPRYTSSLDAAMTLRPEGWHMQLSDWSEPILRERGPWMVVLSPPGKRTGLDPVTFHTRCQHAATPALALCAASLRARAGEGV